MRKIIFGISLLFLGLLFSCKKTERPACTPNVIKAPDYQVEYLTEYLKEQNIDAEKNEYGLFYIIHEEGASKKPLTCANIKVSYKGKVLGSDTYFEESDDYVGMLSSFIAGFQQGMLNVGKGGSITLYIPPRLAYGDNPGTRDIPPGAYLEFKVDLQDFSNDMY